MNKEIQFFEGLILMLVTNHLGEFLSFEIHLTRVILAITL